LVWGVEGIKRAADPDPFLEDLGDPVYDPDFDLARPQMQQTILDACREVEALAVPSGMATHVVSCVMKEFKLYVGARGLWGDFPVQPRGRFRSALEQFLEENPSWRQDVGIQKLPDSPNIQVMCVRVQVSTPLSKQSAASEAWDMYELWEDFTNRFNMAHEGEAQMEQTAELWVQMITEIEAVKGTQSAIIVAMACAVGSIFVFTGDLHMSVLTLINLISIVVCELACFYLFGWQLGIVEAISLTVLVGLSCDFGLHLAESFSHSPFESRNDVLRIWLTGYIEDLTGASVQERATDSLCRVGSPICSAAFTTMLGVVPMLFCIIQILLKFGMIIPLNMMLSIVFGLHFFTPLLIVFGPDKRGTTRLRTAMTGSENILRIQHFIFGSTGRRIISAVFVAVLSINSIEAGRGVFLKNLVFSLIATVVSLCVGGLVVLWEESRPEVQTVDVLVPSVSLISERDLETMNTSHPIIRASVELVVPR